MATGTRIMSEIRVDNITNEAGTGKPGFPNGITATGAALTDPEITGGIYLGGTGSANYLEDYEEGTWTAVVKNSTTTTYNNNLGIYSRVGSLVFVQCNFHINSFGDGDSSKIEGLPFPAEETSGFQEAFVSSSDSSFNSLLLRIDAGKAEVIFGAQTTTDFSSETISFLQNNTRIIFSGTYKTNS